MENVNLPIKTVFYYYFIYFIFNFCQQFYLSRHVRQALIPI